MSFDQALHEKIGRYHFQKMEEAERKEFEKQCLTDPDFGQTVKEHIRVWQGIDALGDAQLEQKMNQWRQNIGTDSTEANSDSQSAKKRNLFSGRWYLMAAAIALLVCISIINWPKGQMSSDALFNQYFELPERSALRGQNDPMELGMAAYGRKDFPAAIKQFEQVIQDSSIPNLDKAHLYLGLSHLMESHSEQALEAFAEIKTDSFDYEVAQWYTAMTMLKADKRMEAQPILEKIANAPSHPFHKKATEVLKYF